MATIVETIAGDRTIQLGNEEYVRKMAIGNDWAKLRIAVRMFINGSAAITTPKLRFGVCSGTTDTFSSSNCVGFYGAGWPNGTAFDLNYSAGVYSYSSGSAVFCEAIKKVGNSVTRIDGSPGLQNAVAAVSLARTSVQFIDLFRSTTNATSYGVRYWNTNTTVKGADSYALRRCTEDENNSTAFTQAYVTTSMGGFGPYYQSGLPTVMDTLSISWTHSVPTIEIAEICIIRFF